MSEQKYFLVVDLSCSLNYQSLNIAVILHLNFPIVYNHRNVLQPALYDLKSVHNVIK
jgi:hypothetical protein